jgi:hypothetical protein
MTEQISIEFLKNFRAEFKDAVKELEEKHGIVINLGSISYDSSHFTSKLEVRLDSVSPNQKYIDTFKLLYKMYGLDEDMLNKSFMANGTTLKFVGLDSKKRNYPCICEGSNGKSYKMSTDQLQFHLSRNI